MALRCYATLPISNEFRAKIIVVHGLGDHSWGLPYRNLGAYLAAHQLAVYGFDLRGHGQSEGLRMFANSWQDLRSDLQMFVNLVKRESASGPLFLIGFSLAGLLVINYAQHFPAGLTGIIAVAPAVDASGVSPLVKLITPLLARLMPKGSLNPGLDLSHISRDVNAVQEYTSDPAFQIKTTTRLAAEVLASMAETRTLAHQLTIPLLILHGTDDTIVLPTGSADFFNELGRLIRNVLRMKERIIICSLSPIEMTSSVISSAG